MILPLSMCSTWSSISLLLSSRLFLMITSLQ